MIAVVLGHRGVFSIPHRHVKESLVKLDSGRKMIGTLRECVRSEDAFHIDGPMTIQSKSIQRNGAVKLLAFGVTYVNPAVFLVFRMEFNIMCPG